LEGSFLLFSTPHFLQQQQHCRHHHHHLPNYSVVTKVKKF
jgi:hypothetical protein